MEKYVIINRFEGGMIKMKRELETQRYLLRIPKMEDAEEIYEKWGRDTEKVAEYKYHNVHKNIIETRGLLKAAIIESEDGIPFWFIESKESGEIIGYIKISEYSEKDKLADVIFYFLENWRKDGSPEEVIDRVIEFLFKEKTFETMVVKFYDREEKDTKLLSSVLERIGMKREGVIRNRMINNEGKKIDRIIYSILKEEWENY